MDSQVSTFHLTLDIGTTGTKAVLLTSSAQQVRAAYRGYQTVHGPSGEIEQHAQDWWNAVVETSRDLGDLTTVASIVLTGQMQNLTLVAADGAPLRPTILYSDTRADSEASFLLQEVGHDRLRQLTGNDQDASSLLAKLLWLRRVEPETLTKATALYLGAADYVAATMTGMRVTDTTTASATGLMDLAERCPLPAEIFRQLGLSQVSELLPEFVPGGASAGTLTRAAAQNLNIRAGTPVYLGPGDAGAATIGAGSGEPGPVYGYVGTSGWVGFSAKERADPNTGTFTLAHPRPGMYFLVAPLLTAAGNLQWIRELFATNAADVPAESFETVIEQALAREPEPLLYLPYLAGERSPIRDSKARGAFVGLTGRTQKADLYRAVLEGVTYSYRHALTALVPGGANALTLTGGGTQSAAWNTLFATVTGVATQVIQNPENVGIKGAYHCVRVATGEIPSYSLEVNATAVTPNAVWKSHYDRMFTLYLTLYPKLSETFAGLAKV